MAWFLNFYRCSRCKRIWTDEWSCTCDDECPHCGARDMSPFDSENLTDLVAQEGDEVHRDPFAALCGRQTALSRIGPLQNAR
jgi:hypothetical protein